MPHFKESNQYYSYVRGLSFCILIFGKFESMLSISITFLPRKTDGFNQGQIQDWNLGGARCYYLIK